MESLEFGEFFGTKHSPELKTHVVVPGSLSLHGQVARCAATACSLLHLGRERVAAGSFGRGVVPLTGQVSQPAMLVHHHAQQASTGTGASRSFLCFQEKACDMSSKSGRKGNSLDHLVPPHPYRTAAPKKVSVLSDSLMKKSTPLSHTRC